MKKRFYLLNFCLLLLFLVLAANATHVRAHTLGRASVLLKAKSTWDQQSEWQPGSSGGFQENRQALQSESNSGNTTFVKGHDQANTGNQGYNRGSVLDHSINHGNQIVNRRETGYAVENIQQFSGRTDTQNRLIVIGRNQANTGNSGVNEGNVEDGNRNSGNQIIN